MKTAIQIFKKYGAHFYDDDGNLFDLTTQFEHLLKQVDQ